jgi:hypothetical protein
LNAAYKVFAKILYDRLLLHANAAHQHYQAGFQSGKSTTDQLFALRQILEKCNEFYITTHHLLKDFKAAYDTIIRNEVYVGMSVLNFPTKLIRLSKVTLTIVTCCDKILNDCSESFETRQGLKQAGVLSTLLFNVILEVILRRANLQTTGRVYNKETQLLAYADDIDIVGRSQSAVRSGYLALEREAAKVGLKINEQKTKYMIPSRNDRTICDVRQNMAIGDKHVEVATELQRRIQFANRCFFGLRKHLQSRHLSRQTKFTIHKTLIRPALLYGSKTWVLPKREENQLLVFERKFLRTICGPKIEIGVYKRRYNHKLDKELNSPNTLNVTKTSRLLYAGYLLSIIYSEPIPMEGEIKQDRNPGGRMG